MRRRQPPPDPAGGRRRLKRIRRDLCVAAGLDADTLSAVDRVRIDQAAFAVVCRDTLQARALAGAAVDVGELERINAALQAILPKSVAQLNVAFVDGSDVCIKCRAPLPPPEELVPIPAQPSPVAAPNDPAATLPADDSPNAPVPANVARRSPNISPRGVCRGCAEAGVMSALSGQSD
jgi:hypothetical protein